MTLYKIIDDYHYDFRAINFRRNRIRETNARIVLSFFPQCASRIKLGNEEEEIWEAKANTYVFRNRWRLIFPDYGESLRDASTGRIYGATFSPLVDIPLPLRMARYVEQARN